MCVVRCALCVLAHIYIFILIRQRRLRAPGIAEYPPSLRAVVISAMFKINKERKKKAKRGGNVSMQVQPRHVLAEICKMWGMVYEEEVRGCEEEAYT